MTEVYSEYDKVYGPYKRKDGRKHVVLVSHKEDGSIEKKTTISYPKYLMEKKLNKLLEPNETVDHIDRDFTNDDYSNLRIIDRIEHIKQDSINVKVNPVKCQMCPKIFTPTVAQRNSRNGDAIAGPFCGRSCTGKYGAMIREGLEPIKRNKINKEYYFPEKT